MAPGWPQFYELVAGGRVDEARALVRSLLEAGAPPEPDAALDGLLELQRTHPGLLGRQTLRAFVDRVGRTTEQWDLARQLAMLPDETPAELEAVFAGFVRERAPGTEKALQAYARAQPERVDALLLPLRAAAPAFHALLASALSEDPLAEDARPLFTKVTSTRSGTRALLVPVVIVVGVLLQLSNCNTTRAPVVDAAPAPAPVVEPSVVMLSPLDELCALSKPDCAVARQVEAALAAHDCPTAQAAHATLVGSTTLRSPSRAADVLRGVGDQLLVGVARCR